MLNLIMEDKTMSLMRFSTRYPSVFDRLFYDDFPGWTGYNNLNANGGFPSVNIRESGDGYEVEMAAPGLTREDFKIELNNDLLTISSERENNNTAAEGHQFTKREFGYRAFSRTFTLPETADSEKIEAKYENGILRLSIPKKEEAKPRPVRHIAVA
jgi:HSP20 family protein